MLLDYLEMPQYSLIHKDIKVIKKYLKNPSDHIIDSKFLLEQACEFGFFDKVKFLLPKLKEDSFCLCAAAQFGHFKIVKYLIKKGPSFLCDHIENAYGQALDNRHYKIAKYLFKRI